MFRKITIDQSDKVFSQFIRKRDKKCVRCGSPVQFNEAGMPISHQCSHFYSRSYERTRHDPENADTLCFNCHDEWEKEKQDKPEYKGDYTKFKINQLGENGFKILKMNAHTFKHKDRKLALIKSKFLLKSIN